MTGGSRAALNRARIEGRFAALRVHSRVLRRRYRTDIDGARTFCLFVGYPRSGHSLLGSLIDAHPAAAISHELNVLRLFRRGFARDDILSLILGNAAAMARSGRVARRDYDYTVPGQWQGRWGALAVVGDKKGGLTSIRFAESPGLRRQFEEFIGLPVKYPHVVRNPFDNVATMFRRGAGRLSLADVTGSYLERCRVNQALRDQIGPERMLDVRLEDVVAEPAAVVRKVASFLGLDAPDEYVSACASIVFPSPRRTRDVIVWEGDARHRLEHAIATTPFLAGYAFDD